MHNRKYATREEIAQIWDQLAFLAIAKKDDWDLAIKRRKTAADIRWTDKMLSGHR